jgi:GDPmannose 4,6-dehydratase
VTRALITGVTGQDGSYLAEQLGAAGWEVAGLVHGQEEPKWEWVQDLVPHLRLIQGDLLDQGSLMRALAEATPDVVFNLGALTFVGTSWAQPVVTAEVTGLGCLRMLEAIRLTNPDIRFVQASSSEMFGNAGSSRVPLGLESPFAPYSPYAAAKVLAHHATVNYRESYGMHASAAIMFNHESARRGTEFVTRKVTKAVAAIAAGRQDHVTLGRLHPCRDWGWAPDYMRGLQLMAALDEPSDFVLATGESHSVAEWCDAAFSAAGLDWHDYVRHDPALCRPAEVDFLQGDASRAREVLGWKPSVLFRELAALMVSHDMAAL